VLEGFFKLLCRFKRGNSAGNLEAEAKVQRLGDIPAFNREKSFPIPGNTFLLLPE